MPKTIFISGASSGFGYATAEKFAAAGYQLILSARRGKIIEELAAALTRTYGVNIQTLCFDVQNKADCFEAIQQLPEAFQAIDILVNNAGLALGRDYFEEANLDDWEIMLDTNVKGIMYLTRAILPLMIKRKSGHIINIGSIAGKEVYEKGNGYCASKHAVDALSKAMRTDLLRHHIKVSGIHPGAANTSFSTVRFKGNEDLAAAVYKGYEPLMATDIANTIFWVAEQPPHVCINDVVITPTAQANSFYLHKE